MRSIYVDPLRPRQNGRRFADDILKCIFLNETVRISIKISLKFVSSNKQYPSIGSDKRYKRSDNHYITLQLWLIA